MYALAQDLAASIDTLARPMRRSALAEQLVRAADSTVLNIAEGAGHFSPGKKVHHYRIAHGSAAECIAALTRMHRRCPDPTIAAARRNANMVCVMLTALIERHERRRRD